MIIIVSRTKETLIIRIRTRVTDTQEKEKSRFNVC